MLHMQSRPSELMGIDDAYTAFCFDEAVAFIISKLEQGEKPIIPMESNNKTYSKPSDIYKKYQ